MKDVHNLVYVSQQVLTAWKKIDLSLFDAGPLFSLIQSVQENFSLSVAEYVEFVHVVCDIVSSSSKKIDDSFVRDKFNRRRTLEPLKHDPHRLAHALLS